MTEDTIRKYAYTKEEVDILIAAAVEEARRIDEESMANKPSKMGESSDIKSEEYQRIVIQNSCQSTVHRVDLRELKVSELNKVTAVNSNDNSSCSTSKKDDRDEQINREVILSTIKEIIRTTIMRGSTFTLFMYFVMLVTSSWSNNKPANIIYMLKRLFLYFFPVFYAGIDNEAIKFLMKHVNRLKRMYQYT